MIKEEKGFTLIEMMVVILLIAVVLIVAVPKVIDVMKTQNNDKYDAHIKLVKQAVDLYVIRHKGEFNNDHNINTYRLNYQKLIQEDLITEESVTCLGSIDLVSKKDNTYTYNYYLKCTDSKDDKKEYSNNFNDKPNCNSSTHCVQLSN